MRNIHIIHLLLVLLIVPAVLRGQTEESLLDLLGSEEETVYATHAFKSTRVVNSHSLEMLGPSTLDFRILHRFGKINQGTYELFGLDQASMRIAFDYGLTPNLMIGAGRSTLRKELDGFFKYRLLWQSTGKRTMPISLIWISGVTMNGLKDPVGNPDVEALRYRRLAYYHQLLIGRKFSEQFSFQLAPTIVHRNIVPNELYPNTLYGIGLGGRLKLSTRVAVVWDYTYVINRFPANPVYNPLTIGFDIETGGHVFQLHFSNSSGMNERAYIAENNGSWLRGDIQFGFNLSRIFQISHAE